MKQDKLHNEQWSDDDFMKSLPEIELPYSRSKEGVWEAMESIMGDEQISANAEVKPEKPRIKIVWYAAAAIFALLLSTTAFLSLYTKTINAPLGQHLTALLPDGSSIELNAGSAIKYKPYWWRFNREVQFEGEGFFKVQKGKTFEVKSSLGRTIVLGTSFNIYARKNDYKVTCYTGKVRVVSIVSGESTEITPNMKAIVENGKVNSYEEDNASETISWINDMFIFTATPIHLVFEEIERQYGIQIESSEKLNYLYSGNFTRDRSAKDVIHMVCRSLGLQYKKTNNGYKVSR